MAAVQLKVAGWSRRAARNCAIDVKAWEVVAPMSSQ